MKLIAFRAGQEKAILFCENCKKFCRVDSDREASYRIACDCDVFYPISVSEIIRFREWSSKHRKDGDQFYFRDNVGRKTCVVWKDFLPPGTSI